MKNCPCLLWHRNVKNKNAFYVQSFYCSFHLLVYYTIKYLINLSIKTSVANKKYIINESQNKNAFYIQIFYFKFHQLIILYNKYIVNLSIKTSVANKKTT